MFVFLQEIRKTKLWKLFTTIQWNSKIRRFVNIYCHTKLKSTKWFVSLIFKKERRSNYRRFYKKKNTMYCSTKYDIFIFLKSCYLKYYECIKCKRKSRILGNEKKKTNWKLVLLNQAALSRNVVILQYGENWKLSLI